MRLTLEQDYAIRIVYELCRFTPGEGRDRLDVGQLSALTGVTPLFTQKIMRKLGKAGMVLSKKGVSGGYVLADGLTSEKISLYDVFLAMNGSDLFINACLSGDYRCNRPEVVENRGECYIRKAMGLLNENLVSALREVTFDRFIN